MTKKLKGKERPLVNESDRAKILLSIKYVDYVTIFDESTPKDIIEKIKPDTLVNADVSSSAEIAQSKLNMQTAGTRANATGISQADLGLATFKDTEFTETSGFVELQTSSSTSTGIDPSKLQHVGTDTVLGRSAAGDGAVSAISFDTVLNEGGALRDSEFGAFGNSGDEVLIRTAAATYDTTEVTTGNEANRIVKTQSDGSIRVNSLRLGGTNTYEVMSLSSTTLQLKTPGQATILEAAGTKWNFLPFVPGLVGGHCIGVDPYYLTHKASEVGFDPEMILSGRSINDGMGNYIANEVTRLMTKKGINLVDGFSILSTSLLP